MPRETLLRDIKGAEGLICMLSDKIDKQVLDAAGKLGNVNQSNFIISSPRDDNHNARP